MISSSAIEWLPVQCLVFLPGLPEGCNIGVATRGEPGVRLMSMQSPHGEPAWTLVARLNRDFGITPVQQHAMLSGALRGWDHPRSDPRLLPMIDPRFAFDGLPAVGSTLVH